MNQVMKNTIGFVSKVSDWVQKLSLFLAGVILIAMVIVAGLGVFYRFVLESALSWNEELDGYLFVWLTSLGAAIGYKYRAHPAVEIIVSRVSSKIKKILSAIADLIVLSLGLILIIYGQQMAALSGTETAFALPITMMVPYLAIPVGGAALVIHAIAHILNGITNSDNSSAEPVKEELTWEH